MIATSAYVCRSNEGCNAMKICLIRYKMLTFSTLATSDICRYSVFFARNLRSRNGMCSMCYCTHWYTRGVLIGLKTTSSRIFVAESGGIFPAGSGFVKKKYCQTTDCIFQDFLICTDEAYFQVPPAPPKLDWWCLRTRGWVSIHGTTNVSVISKRVSFTKPLRRKRVCI